jgi:antitoxin (DNA-binding transcriptional repressor) of toxin-antitoxin stability system
MLDILSDMKRISAREFQKRFGRIAASMREGQTLEVTIRGKPVGRFTKHRTRERRMPDFVSLLESESCPKELGNQILKEFDDSLS